jgi:hypothetical protein
LVDASAVRNPLVKAAAFGRHPRRGHPTPHPPRARRPPLGNSAAPGPERLLFPAVTSRGHLRSGVFYNVDRRATVPGARPPDAMTRSPEGCLQWRKAAAVLNRPAPHRPFCAGGPMLRAQGDEHRLRRGSQPDLFADSSTPEAVLALHREIEEAEIA